MNAKKRNRTTNTKLSTKLLRLFILLVLTGGGYWVYDTQQDPRGKIVNVSDGDTVTLLSEDNEQIKIRLWGIDCPERSQDYGRKATERTKDLCYGKTIRIDCKGKDKYGRTLGIVYVDSVNVNETLIKEGLAWKYKTTGFAHYVDLEDEARAQKLNIWSMPNAIAPWDYRKAK